MRYALIENGKVVNIIWLHPANAKDFPGAVYLNDDLPVRIGDDYDGENFYRDGAQVVSDYERIVMENKDMNAALALLGVEGSEA